MKTLARSSRCGYPASQPVNQLKQHDGAEQRKALSGHASFSELSFCHTYQRRVPLRSWLPISWSLCYCASRRRATHPNQQRITENRRSPKCPRGLELRTERRHFKCFEATRRTLEDCIGPQGLSVLTCHWKRAPRSARTSDTTLCHPGPSART